MPTPLKYLLIFISFILILIVGLIVLIQTQVTPDKIRQHLLPLAEKTLQRDIELGRIDVGLLAGVTLSDLVVKQKDNKGDFISVKYLQLNYRLLSLLKGKVEIDKVILSGPEINMTRRSDGRLNFDDLISKKSSPRPAGDSGDSKALLKVTDVPLNLLVKEVRINDGQLLFSDRYLNSRSPYHYRLENLNADARRITLDGTFPFDLSAVLNGSQIDISGNYDLAAGAGDLIVHTAPVDLVRFAPYYRDKVPFKIGSGQLAMNIEVDLLPQSIASKGRFDLTDIDLNATGNRDISFEDSVMSMDYSLAFDLGSGKLDIKTMMVNFNDLKAGLEGRIDLHSDGPYLAAKITLDQLDLRQVMQVVPPVFVRDFQKYSLAGSVDGHFDLEGTLGSGGKILQDAVLTLDGVQLSAHNLRTGISGSINYKDKVASGQGLILKYGELEASLDFKAQNLFAAEPTLEFALKADQLDLNRLQDEAPQSDPPGETQVQGNGQENPVPGETVIVAEEWGPYDIPLMAQGSVEVNQLLYRDLRVERLTSEVSLQNNRLTLTDIAARVGNGDLTGEGVLDLGVRGLAYRGAVKVAQPNIATLVSGLFPETNQAVTGQMAWENSFAGQGSDINRLLEELRLSGHLNLVGGSIEGSALFKALALFLGDAELELLSFQSFSGQYQLNDGVVDLLGDLKSSKIELTPKGTIGTDGRLNLNVASRLSPGLLAKLGVGSDLKKVVTDSSGWGSLPLQIGGTLDSPDIGFDDAALKRMTLQKAKEKATEKLLDKLPGGEQDGEPIRQLLDDTLNKLFGN